jgi:polyhydroxybutyrate depolymerase
MRLLLILILSGYLGSAQTGVLVTDSIHSSGVFRKFYFYIPASYDSLNAVPLLIDLHDLSANAQSQQSNSGFMMVSDTAGFLLVNPQGSGVSPYWNAGLSSGSPYDVQFISDLIDSLSARFVINSNRVYACGFGNGGIMSYYLSCGLYSKIAAIASVAGTMNGNWFNSCNPNRAVPVMEINGTQDATVPYQGSSLYVPVDSVIKSWRLHNKCSSTPVTYSVADTNTTDNSTAVNVRYTGGIDNSTVELFTVTGGSHSWPGSVPVVPSTNLDFSASAEIWRFFRQFSLSQFTTKVGVNEHAQLAVRIFPNPSSTELIIDGMGASVFSVMSADGKKVAEGIVHGVLDISQLQNGIYYLTLERDGYRQGCKFIKN